MKLFFRLKIRCGTVNELLESGCPGPESAENWIFDSPSKATVAIEGKSQTIRPQVVNVKMRKNGPVDVNIRFKRPSTYPVDMYYLMGKGFENLIVPIYNDKKSIKNA